MLNLLNESPHLLTVVIFFTALLIGSFLNVVIYRLPIMLEREWRSQAISFEDSSIERFNLLLPRSHCVHCNELITIFHNIPVLSFLYLKGRCANCNKSISLRYPFVELLTGFLLTITAIHFNFGIEALMAAILTAILIVVSMIDKDTQIIPDSIVIPLLWMGLSISLIHPLTNTSKLFISPSDAIIGALVGYLSLWSVFWTYKLCTGKDGLGYGDFKLLAALGAWLGWQQILFIIMLSAITGLLINFALIIFLKKDRNTPIPFGPYLSFSGWIAMIWSEEIKNYYFNLIL